MANGDGWSLRGRLTSLIGMILTLTLLLAGAGLWQLHRMSDRIESVYKDRVVPMQQLRRMQKGLMQDLPLLLGRLQAGVEPQRLRREIDELSTRMQRDWDDYLLTEMVERELVLIERTKPQLAQAHQLMQALRDSRADADLTLPLRELRLRTLTLDRLLDELVDLQLLVARQTADAAKQAVERAVWLALGVVLAAIGLGAALAMAVWMRYRREQDEETARRERLQRFYKALSETNQLIVRRYREPAALFEGLCRICVSTGQASLASVVLLEGQEFRRVALDGPAERLMPGVPARWSVDADFVRSSMSCQAIRANAHVIKNRALQDPELTRPPAPLLPPGVEAMAAFVLRRRGVAIGALSLLAGDPDFFDEELVRLLDEMAGDVSFALGDAEDNPPLPAPQAQPA